MSRRRVVEIVADQGSQTMVLRGWNVAKLSREAGCRPIYTGVSRGWLTDLRRLPDLCAWLDYRNIAYTVTDAPETT